MDEKVGRNDPCPCGSGLKYKKCCYGKPAKPKFKAKVIKSGKEILPSPIPPVSNTFQMTERDFRVNK